MQTKLRISSKSKAKSPAAKGTSKAIADHTAAFLKAGGKITKIRPGTRDEEVSASKELAK